MRRISGRARPIPNRVEYILPLVNDEQVLLDFHLGEFVDHFQVFFVDAKNFALPVAEVRVGDGSEPACLLLGSCCYNFLPELRIACVRLALGWLITLEQP